MIASYLRLLRYVRPYAAGLGVAVFCMCICSLTTMLYAFLSGPLITGLVTGDASVLQSVLAYVPSLRPLVEGDRYGVLRVLPILLLAVALIKGIAYAGEFYLVRTIGQSVVIDLRNDLFDKALRLSPRYHSEARKGDLLSRFMHDVAVVEASVTDASADLARNALQLLGLVIQSFFLDFKLALLSFVVVPAAYYPISRFSLFIKRVAKESQVSLGRLSSLVHEALHGMRIIQVFSAEQRVARRFHDEGQRYLGIMRRSIIARGAYSPTMEILGVVAVAGLLWYATGRIVSGELSPAHFVSFLTTMFLLYGPIKAVGKLSNQIVHGVAAAERIYEVVDAPEEITDRPGASVLKSFVECVRFEGVRFGYSPGEEVLRGVDLEARRGQVVAIVGSSGAGKTTLVNLLPRFYDVTSGRICIDGVDLRDVTLASLRSQIALVSQDVFLFDATVRDNVRFARPQAGEEQVREALQAAHALDFVEALPGRLDAQIGELGSLLSGGQRQRLAIARAILADAPILILDEATSALDTESERAVQAALDNLMAGRTAFVIAHRLSTVRRAEEIAVLQDGVIVERGRHEQLLAAGGAYARLYQMQFADQDGGVEAIARRAVAAPGSVC
ncbi:MAG: ATP-binding cassette domain-containing protein [Deltaproteobacteria bacterium]|nr:ATP-binding cassette domain-containing protein [Deltaproteobacteria bacterium]